MKAVLALLTFLVVVASCWIIFPCSTPVFAQQPSACCKERDSFRAPWRKNGLTFDSCKRLNDKRDRDDVYQEEGLVWWDRRCS